jgi:glutamine amidotransferase
MSDLIVDYGIGNLSSVKKKLQSCGSNVLISNDPNKVKRATKIILPGVGHFNVAMQNLQKLCLIDVLNEAVLIKKVPVLGICLGMQIMTVGSEEGTEDGLGWFDDFVVKFDIKNQKKYKVPHMGWNTLKILKHSILFDGIAEEDEFYFLHSYHIKSNNFKNRLAITEYEYPFISAIEKDNIFGVQFHPEKSHQVGEKILNNFIKI